MCFVHGAAPPRQQIGLISENNKAWKALEREKNKTVEVVAVISSCVASNGELKQANDAAKTVSNFPARLGVLFLTGQEIVTDTVCMVARSGSWFVDYDTFWCTPRTSRCIS